MKEETKMKLVVLPFLALIAVFIWAGYEFYMAMIA